MEDRRDSHDRPDRRFSGGGGGGGRGGRDYRRAPRRDREPPAEPPEQILASLLFQIGDKTEGAETESLEVRGIPSPSTKPQASLQGTLEQLVRALESKLGHHRGILLKIIIPM